MSTSLIQNSFGGGELSPSLAKRADLTRYKTSVAVLRNMFIHKHAAVSNRGGFRYVGETKETDVRLIPFVFSDDQAYVLEFGDEYMRVIKDGAYVINSPGRGTSIVETGVYQWTASGSGTNEYYLELSGGGDPSMSTIPEEVFEDVGGADTALTKGTLGSLAVGGWGHGDNDTLGFDTIYVRLSDEVDPDTKADGYLEASYIYEVTDGETSIDPVGRGLFLNKEARRYAGWIASGSGTNEYWFSANPLSGGVFPSNPSEVLEYYQNIPTLMTPGTLGSLQPGEWAFGDNDGIGANTVYVRPTDGIDPDSKGINYIEALYGYTVSLPSSTYLRALDYVQSYDTMYITGDPNNIRRLTRLDHDLWIPEKVDMTGTEYTSDLDVYASSTATNYHYAVAGVGYDGVEAPIAEPDSASPYGTSIDSGATTETYAATGLANTDQISWTLRPEFEKYRIYKNVIADTDAYGFIAEIEGSKFKDTNNLTPDYGQNPKIRSYPFGDNSYTEANRAPLKCAMQSQRLILGNVIAGDPKSIYGSVIGDYENFTKSNPIKDDDTFSFIIDSERLNPIRWMHSVNELLVGTAEGEYRVAGSGGGIITPTSIEVKKQSEYGSMDNLRPVVIANRAHYATRAKNVIRDLSYSFETNSYIGNDVTIFVRHLFDNKEIVAWAYQKDPHSILWVVKDDGSIAALTNHREQEIAGWHRHDTPNGLFKDVVSIPSGNGDDELYVHVHREVNGTTKSFVERLHTRLPASDDDTYDVKDAFMVDSGLTYDVPLSIEGITQANPGVVTITGHGLVDGDTVDIAQVVGMTELNGNRYKVLKLDANTFTLTTVGGTDIDTTNYTAYESGGYVREAVTTLSGLDHLEGETVDVLQDGFVTQKTVSGGSITLSVAASRVHAGLSYGWELKTLSFAPITEEAVLLDKPRDIAEAMVEFENTRGVSVGGRDEETYEVEFRTDEEMGDPTRLFTGHKIISVSPGEDAFDGFVLLKSDKPLPVTINAIIPKVNYGTM